MQRHLGRLAFILLLASLVLGPALSVSAQVQIGSTTIVSGPVSVKPIAIKRYKVEAGDDGWATPAGTSTKAFFDNVTVPGACGLNDGSLNGFVNLKGEPLPSNNPGAVGSTDTIVRRLSSTPYLAMNASATVGLQIQGLNLVSESPVSVSCPGADPTFDVRATLSESAQPIGSITFTRSHQDGGTFTSALKVIPKFTLSPTAGGSDIVLDCGQDSVDCGSEEQLDFASSGTPWTLAGGPGGWQPGDSNINTLPSGTKIDGNGNGVLDTVLIGTSNGFPGIDPDLLIALLIKELELLAEHEANPPEEEEPEPCRNTQTVSRDAQGRTVIIIDDACVEPIEPDIEPIEPGQIGVVVGL